MLGSSGQGGMKSDNQTRGEAGARQRLASKPDSWLCVPAGCQQLQAVDDIPVQ